MDSDSGGWPVEGGQWKVGSGSGGWKVDSRGWAVEVGVESLNPIIKKLQIKYLMQINP